MILVALNGHGEPGGVDFGHCESGGFQVREEIGGAEAEAEGIRRSHFHQNLARVLQQLTCATEDGELGTFDVDLQQVTPLKTGKQLVERRR